LIRPEIESALGIETPREACVPVNPPTTPGSLMEEQLRRMLARTPRVAARPDLVVDLIRPVDARRPPARRERPGPG
jgi:hypothetical protein